MKIVQDFKAFTKEEGMLKKISTILFNPCFHSVCLYRLAGLFNSIHLSVVAKIIWYLNRMLFHVDIDYRADLAGGFFLVHGLGTVIGKSVKSYGRLTVFQGVTIGGNNGRTRTEKNGNIIGQPVFGEGVIVFANACVVGPIYIGDNEIVKAGTVVSKDVGEISSHNA